jgi:hypothetical protein
VKNKSKLLKQKLNNNDNPILALFEVGNKPIYLSRTIKKTSIPFNTEKFNNDPDNRIKKYDVIGIKTGGSYIDYAAVFLGKNKDNANKVVYASSENNINWRAKIDT